MSEPAKVTGEAECPFCGGWGYPPHDPYGMCDMCGGDGALPIIELTPQHIGDTRDMTDTFSMIDYDDNYECSDCGGTGQTESCFEDTCCCVNPPCLIVKCESCAGTGILAVPAETN